MATRATPSRKLPPPLVVRRAQTAVVPKTRGCVVTAARSCVAGRPNEPSRLPLAQTPRSDCRAFTLRAAQMADADPLQPVVRSFRLLDTGTSRIRQGRVGRVPWLLRRARPTAACAAFVLFFRRTYVPLRAILIPAPTFVPIQEVSHFVEAHHRDRRVDYVPSSVEEPKAGPKRPRKRFLTSIQVKPTTSAPAPAPAPAPARRSLQLATPHHAIHPILTDCSTTATATS